MQSLGKCQGVCLTGIRKYEREFLTALAANNIRLPGVVVQNYRQTLQNCVACKMALGVIHLLEVVDINYGYRDVAERRIWGNH